MNEPNKQVRLSWLDRFNKNYPKMLRFISELTLIIFSLLKTLLTTVGLPVILVLLAIVEVNRVESGIGIFEENIALARFGAWVLVLLNFTVEFTIHYVVSISDYTPEVPLRGSLRLFKRGMAYRMGVGKDWQVKKANPANSFIGVQNLITFTIIALALSGSMKDEIIAQGEVAWHAAFINIMFSSSLATMMTWVSGLLFTITAVLSAQIIAKYIAIQALQAENDMRVVAKKISYKEKGIVIITAKQARERYKAMKNLRYLTEDDKLQIGPVFSFYDGKVDSWSRKYKTMQSLQRVVEKTNAKRKSEAVK